FVLKKVLGEHLTATTAKAQRQQTRFRIIAYNAYKKSSLFLFEHFYAAGLEHADYANIDCKKTNAQQQSI
ncbi:MAG: hypothetical protein ABH879_02730, partial [archaeon]